MKRTHVQRILSCVLMLCMLLSCLPAMAAAPALRAYSTGGAVTTDAEGKTTGFYFAIGAQYGTKPYSISYTVTSSGGVSVSGNKTDDELYCRVYGTFASGTYTFTANVTDAVGAKSSASAVMEYVENNGFPQSTRVLSAVYPEAVKVQEIKLPVTEKTLRVGDTFALKPSVLPEDAANKAITYATNNAGVATVDQDGLITAVSAGTCTIICAASGGTDVTAECQIVVEQPVTGLSLTPAAVTVAEGGTYKLQPVISPANATNKEVSYASGNKAVVVVANDGTITGVSAGVASVTVSSKDDPTKMASVTVTVGTPVGAVELSPKSMELKTGTAMTLSASVTPDTATNKTLVWSSSDTAVATVDASGRVSVWKAGTAVITARAVDGSEKFATCNVTATGDDVTPPTTTPPTTPPTTTAPTTTTPSTTTPPPAPGGETAYVRTEQGGLNMRVEPRQSSRRILVIPQNAAVTVVTEGTAWCYVYYNGTYGYVMTKFLSIYNSNPDTGSTETVAPPASGQAAQVDTEKGGLNMRKNPDQSSRRLLIIPEDGYFTVVTYGKTWCYAYYNGTYGYVMTKFVKLLTAGTVTPGPDAPETTPPETTPPETDAPETDTPVSDVYGIVTTEQGRLNLRKQPNTDAGIIKRIDQGKAVKILSYGLTWCFVEYNGTRGYVMTKFLTFTTTPPAEPEAPEAPEEPETPAPPVSDEKNKYAQVTTEQGSLNMRRSQSTGSSLVRRIPQNAYVKVVQYGSTWCRVVYNGTYGYVMTKFLTMI